MDGVNTHHPDFERFSPKWKRCRDVMAGQDAVHAAKEAYLPKLKDQEQTDYLAYVKRAGFYNASYRTLSGLVGMMFRKPPERDLPPAIDSYMEDVDMAGTSLETFARKVSFETLSPGRVGIMVDHPKVELMGPMTVKAAESLGLRPMLKLYKAECIINWRYERIDNHWKLSMVVLKETAEVQENEFKAKTEDRWRVLDLDGGLYRQRVFRKRDKAKTNEGEFELLEEFRPLMRGAPLSEIPFAIVGPDGMDSELDEPPLIDLVDVNLSHYRTNADYEHGCHFTGLPTAWVAGYSPATNDRGETTERLYIGSTAAWLFPDPQAKAGFLEFTGQGLGALKDNLDRKEQQMAILGARMIAAEKKQAETATTAAIHRTGENSVLASVATAVSEALEWALGLFSEWAGASGKVVYQLNRDFNPAMLSAQDITAYMKAVQMGLLSEQTFYELMQRADVANPERDWEAEQELIAQDGPERPAEPANDLGAAA